MFFYQTHTDVNAFTGNADWASFVRIRLQHMIKIFESLVEWWHQEVYLAEIHDKKVFKNSILTTCY